MITVDLFEDGQGRITGYQVLGHADSNPEGFDEVCALVSLTTQLPILGLEQVLHRKVKYSADQESGALAVALEESADEQTELLFRTMVCGLRELKKYYPQYLTTQEHRR